MSMRSTRDDRLDAARYARLQHGLGLNLLVGSVEDALPFHLRVLGATCVYADEDFAALRFEIEGGGSAQWMLHADHTYDSHPLYGLLTGVRGAGAEFRLYGRDPDRAEAIARELGCHVLAGAIDTAHGLRETFILEPDGYLWVPCRAVA